MVIKSEDMSGFSVNGLLLMYERIQFALNEDDKTPPNQPKPYEVRTYPAWKTHAAALEKALDDKGIHYKKIAWSIDRA